MNAVRIITEVILTETRHEKGVSDCEVKYSNLLLHGQPEYEDLFNLFRALYTAANNGNDEEFQSVLDEIINGVHETALAKIRVYLHALEGEGEKGTVRLLICEVA